MKLSNTITNHFSWYLSNSSRKWLNKVVKFYVSWFCFTLAVMMLVTNSTSDTNKQILNAFSTNIISPLHPVYHHHYHWDNIHITIVQAVCRPLVYRSPYGPICFSNMITNILSHMWTSLGRTGQEPLQTCPSLTKLLPNYNGEIGQKFDLVITFDWRVLLTLGQRVGSAFCKIFSRTPNLTIFCHI